MRRKICPVCDMPLEGGCYCKLCRRIVLRPVELEQSYYLNERHPAAGARPEGGQGVRKGLSGNAQPVKKSETQPGIEGAQSGMGKGALSDMWREKRLEWEKKARSDRGESWRRTGRYGSRADVPKNIAGLAVLFICIFLCLFAVIGINTYRSISVSVSDEIEEADWQEEYDNISRELDEETVRQRGVSCTLYGHSSIKKEAMVNAVREFLIQEGIVMWEENFYTNNQEFFYGDGSQASAYQSEVILGFSAESEQEIWDSSLDVWYDTATEELHGICMSSRDIDLGVSFAENFVRMVDQADNLESFNQEEMERGIRSFCEESDTDLGYWLEGDNWSIETYCSDGVLTIYIMAEGEAASVQPERMNELEALE